MASMVKNDDTGEQINDAGRGSWLAHGAERLMEPAAEHPQFGPLPALSMLLHHGLGLPLSLIGKLIGIDRTAVAQCLTDGARDLHQMDDQFADEFLRMVGLRGSRRVCVDEDSDDETVSLPANAEAVASVGSGVTTAA